jgi:hypothetical protein
MPEQDAYLLKVLIGQISEHREINSVANRCAYCPRPSFSSQSATCCIADPALAISRMNLLAPE